VCHSEPPVRRIASRPHLDDWDEQRSNMPQVIKCTSKNALCTKGENKPPSTFNHAQ